MILPDLDSPPGDERPSYTDGYAIAAPIYLQRGWLSVLPLPPGQKWPPPTGYTGGGAALPATEQVGAWCREMPMGNPALYLTDGLLAVDIDNYAKKDRPAGRALEVIAEVEERAGVRFPATWLLRNRIDGSEKRLYRVPTGLQWRSNLGAGVDLVHSGYRYVNVGINPDTGNPEQWFTPLGDVAVEPPSPDDLTFLPDGLVLELMRDAGGTEIRGLSAPSVARELLEKLPEGVMAARVRTLMSRALEDLSGLNGSRHDATLNRVRDLVRYGAAGLSGVDTALNALRRDFVEAVWDAPDRGSREIAEAEFDRMAVNAGQLAAAMDPEELALIGAALKSMAPGGQWHPERLFGRRERASGERFRLVSAAELAEPIKPIRWLVSGIWPERSAGVLAGDKKSLKTWNLQAIALAVAAGVPLFGKYDVVTPGPVLYLCGEGGVSTFANRHQVIAKRYGVEARLRELPLGVEFGVGRLSDQEFADAVNRSLDALQPSLVILDPLYAYHPSDVEVSNLYSRGPMLAELRELIGGEAALIVGDHFNKSAGERLELDNIAQAGMGQWADSWILQKHRKPPELDGGKFLLDVETGTRRGAGQRIEVDWTLERNQSDPDLIGWSSVDWETRSAVAKSVGERADKTVAAILQVVADRDFELTESAVLNEVRGNRAKAREAFAGLKANGALVVRNCPADEGGRTVSRDRVGLGENAARVRTNRFRIKAERARSENEGSTDTGDCTGSERVADDD